MVGVQKKMMGRSNFWYCGPEWSAKLAKGKHKLIVKAREGINPFLSGQNMLIVKGQEREKFRIAGAKNQLVVKAREGRNPLLLATNTTPRASMRSLTGWEPARPSGRACIRLLAGNQHVLQGVLVARANRDNIYITVPGERFRRVRVLFCGPLHRCDRHASTYLSQHGVIFFRRMVVK